MTPEEMWENAEKRLNEGKYVAKVQFGVAVDKEHNICAIRCEMPGCSWQQFFKSFEVGELRVHDHMLKIHGLAVVGDSNVVH